MSSGDVDILGLLTTVTPAFDRVSVHGTRRSILRAHADGLGLEVFEVELPHPCGERGQFHTCVVRGSGLPPLDVEIGPKVRRDGSVFVDLQLARAPAATRGSRRSRSR